MLIVRIGLGIVLGYLLLVLLAWRFQERLAFPAPRARVPDPKRLGIPGGERIELTLAEGTKLVGWFLPPPTHDSPTPPGGTAVRRNGGTKAPGLLWFYGNGENIATIWPVLREFQPPGASLLVVDYPGATTAADKVALVVGNYASMYAMYLATYVLFGVALGVLAFALYDRLQAGAPATTRIATAMGLLWSVALVTSGMVCTYGMSTIVTLAKSDPEQARLAWQAIEPVALGLGGAGGEILGGLWVLLLSWVALRGAALPKALGWFGVVLGVVGLASVVPPLHDAAIAFGLLQIVWFVWIGTALMTAKATAAEPGSFVQAPVAQADHLGARLRSATGDPDLV